VGSTLYSFYFLALEKKMILDLVGENGEWQRRQRMFRVTVTASGTVTMSFRGGTNGVCMHVSTSTLKSIMKLRKSV